MKLNKFLITSIAALALTACGGGGSGETVTSSGSVTPPAPPTLTVVRPESKNIKELESYSFSIDIEYTGSESVEVKIDSMTDNVLAVINEGNVLTVEAQDVNSVNEMYSVSITIQAGGFSESFEQIGNIVNTSLLAQMDFAENLVRETNRFKVAGAAEVIVVNNFLIEQSFLLGNIKESEMAGLKETVIRVVNEAFDNIENSTQDLKTLGALYNAEQINELNFQDYIVRYREIRKDSLTRLAKINTLYDQYDMADMQIPTVSDVFNEEDMSLYKGNQKLGEFVADDWEYSSDYQYLELLIGKNKMNCEA